MLLSRCFLGGNTGTGFVSLYDELVTGEEFLYVIKGSPGCGKSSLMRRIAAAAQRQGLEVQEVWCSGDPDSLDAIVIPACHLAYVDGTAPHVRECPCPGGDSAYLDLGQFLSLPPLRAQRAQLQAQQQRIREAHAAAGAALQAAGALAPQSIAARLALPERLEAPLRTLAESALPPARYGPPGKVHRAFVSAVTCQGLLFMSESLREAADRLIAVADDCGLAGAALQQIAQVATRRGYDVLVCPGALVPSVPDAVVLPEIRLGFVTARLESSDPCKTPFAETLSITENLSRAGKLFRSAAEAYATAASDLVPLYEQTMQAAVRHLMIAHTEHDALEALYQPCVDFDGVRALADTHIAMLSTALDSANLNSANLDSAKPG